MRIAIVDYGMGNLLSVRNEYEFLVADVEIVSTSARVADFGGFILPGVGAFGEGVAGLHKRGFVDALEREVIQKKKPFLGICLGLHLLATTGFELGTFQWLDWVGGVVDRLRVPTSLRVPHIGWNAVEGRGALFENLPPGSAFYFVHSYCVTPANTAAISGTTEYGDRFVSAIEQDNVLGVQFHPEKSHKIGLALLRNFLAFADARQC